VQLPRQRDLYWAIGVFDGVHRGHRAIVQRLVDEAREGGALPCVMTFDPHPLAVLQPEAAPPLLTTLSERLALLAALGAERILVVPFTRAFARLEPEAFIHQILIDRLRARRVYVGFSFRFGRGGRGSPGLLRRVGEPRGLEVREFDPITDDRTILSSTQIRQALQTGDVAAAARALGRPHAVEGIVVHGDARGRQLGFPTANLPEQGPVLWPGDGVYAIAACFDGTVYGGVANLGRRPTVAPDGPRLLEVHLFGFSGDLYGRRLRVAFLERLRGERRFAGLDELRAQIDRDAASARRVLEAVLPRLARVDVCGPGA
ncbi:MAG TPA: bifunctional riboflavin kinase/FAD synthetase, partial [Bacillota bacterium]